MSIYYDSSFHVLDDNRYAILYRIGPKSAWRCEVWPGDGSYHTKNGFASEDEALKWAKGVRTLQEIGADGEVEA